MRLKRLQIIEIIANCMPISVCDLFGLGGYLSRKIAKNNNSISHCNHMR